MNQSNDNQGDSKGSSKPPAEWIKSLETLLERIDPKDTEQALQDMEAFVEGDATWAEVQGLPKQMLFDMAEQAYLKFRGGRLEEAKAIFHGLSLLDHTIAYFHTALGAIYQKEKNFFDALAQYTLALELDPQDITAYANRGEVYYMMDMPEDAIKDFDQANGLDNEKKDPWANRARFLKQKLIKELKELEGKETSHGNQPN